MWAACGRRRRSRSWPLPAVAVALPLIPAAVNLAQGGYHWIGPRGAIEHYFRVDGGTDNALLWLVLDVGVGVGGPALLILAAVVRRTRRALWCAKAALVAAAAVGFVSALTAAPPVEEFDSSYDGSQIYPGGPRPRHLTGVVRRGPAGFRACSWRSSIRPAAPAARRRMLLVAQVAILVALAFVPVADLAREVRSPPPRTAPRPRSGGGSRPRSLSSP